ncbi:protein SHORT ROOT IN SALT MEDIUM 1-like [Glycine soja]|uniref:Cell division cycle and apoptosis regulator protein 1 n=2 Tax=Glycine soja TaxID=3848 RepID=A0A445LMB7_GLYSO|nr:protein SHORT ROOT IN SALT MEDIUM 1-like [Glycine soja]RZC24418.1 Cell division cycle and apoptosis regulator protein 1 [Glycine soja]
MYSRGSGGYGQSYTGQSAYGQNLGANYSGSSVGGHDAGQHSVASRHSTILGGSQDVDVGGYRPSAAAQYGGQYSSVYGSAALSSAQQVPSLSTKGSASSALDGRGGYALGVSDSPKFASGDYVSSSSHGYGHKSDQLYGDKGLEYSGLDRRQYGERQSGYLGRDLTSDPAGRYAADPVGFSHQRQQSEIYDRIDQAALLRQEQLLKAQSLQAASLDGGARQADYLAARAAASRHPTQDLVSYGGRMDSDPRASSMLSATSYSGQHAPSILGAAPRRNVDDILYSQNASNPGYGVSLPPGRDYASGKGLHGNAMELDYPGNVLPHGGHTDRKDDRASYLREFELREEERRRERLRERERDREKEKERERLRERERERERERDRIMERREKERERERKRALETKPERTPARSSKDPRGTSKDPRGSSLTKEGRSTRRDSPHHGALHRHHSPVKEKRREYVCKVFPSRLVDIERDYLLLDKRYPRLFVSPEFSKVVVNWPKENLKLSIHTPVSFEHDFVEEENATEPRDSSNKLLVGQLPNSEHGNTVWNAKIILMNGLSRSALEELSSDKIVDDRIPHFCNFLRFGVLKKDHSFMAVGGPWEPVDGGDPSIDNNSLIKTALRYANDVIQLDLQNCQHWNPFLEIHYDRIGKDGFFSHKEITVLYVPDLSDCLPSLDEWREKWLAHKKSVAERERQLSLKKEKSRDNKEESKDKSDKRKDSTPSGKSDVKKKEKDNNTVKEEIEGKTGVNNNNIVKNEGSDIGEEGKSAEKKLAGETATGQTTGGVKSVKKKIIKRVVKQKVATKANAAATKANAAATKQTDKAGEKDVAEEVTTSNVTDRDGKFSVDPTGVQTPIKNLVAEDMSIGKIDGEEGKDTEINSSEDKPQNKPDPIVNAVASDPAVKTTKKKKIIKRVPKKKVVGEASKSLVSEPKKDVENQGQDGTLSSGKQTADANTVVTEVKKPGKVVPKKKIKTPVSKKQEETADSNKTETPSDKKDEGSVVAVQAQDDTQSTGKQTANADTTVTPEVKKTGKVVPKKQSKTPMPEKRDNADTSKTETKSDKDDKKEERGGTGEKSGAKTDKQKASDVSNVKGKVKEGDKSKDEKVTKERDGKDEGFKSKSSKEVKDKRKSDEPPRHPGFILQTKWTKDSKIRSLSLSLDSLLDYTDKDVEESNLELSLFAESFYEMLQFQMGSRILTFLQKLRIKFVIKRNQKKRQRDDEQEKDDVKKSPVKRQKGDDPSVKSEPTNMDTSNPTQVDDEKAVVENENSSNKEDDVKMEDGSDEEEDPEEDPEEYEEMENGSPQHEASHDNNAEQEVKADTKSENITTNNKTTDETSKEEIKVKDEVQESKADAQVKEEKEGKDDTKKETPAVKEVVVDRELLQAFRFFDRNRVGYIRVEDMRIILHNLGMFFSHRDVKELVQSALLESNTGRDDRILYNKLVRMSDI